MFSSPALILGLILIALAAAFLLLCPTAPGRPSSPPHPGEVSVSAAEGSIVTVRKVGGVTSVVVHSHWEGEDGITPPALPPEITRAREPELYAVSSLVKPVILEEKGAAKPKGFKSDRFAADKLRLS